MSSRRLAASFVPATGIDREVITRDICRYLGSDAASNSGELVRGFLITSYRPLTIDQLNNIKADSARLAAERARNQTNRGLQNESISRLRYSNVDVRNRSSVTQTQQLDDAALSQPVGPQSEHYTTLLDSSYETGLYDLSQAHYGIQESISPVTNLPRFSEGIGLGYQSDNNILLGHYNPVQQFLIPDDQGQSGSPGQLYQHRDSYQSDDIELLEHYNPFQEFLILDNQGQSATPEQLYQHRDGVPGPQEDQGTEVFADQQGQPPKPTSPGHSSFRTDRSHSDSDRGADMHPATLDETHFRNVEKEVGKEVEVPVPAISQDKRRESVDPDISPETMRSTLASGKIKNIKWLLDQHFSSVAKEEFTWLQELREHGYETEEIAQLLSNEHNDSPWIYFESRRPPIDDITPDHHEPFCVHVGGEEVRHRTLSIFRKTSMDRKDHRLSLTSDNESLTHIEEFCGIAGVVPNTRDLSKQVGSVNFVEEDGTLTASVSFHFDTKADKEKHKLPGYSDCNNIRRALRHLCSAIACAQRSGLCCDSFTVLQFSVISAQEVIELRHIKVRVILDLYIKLSLFIRNSSATDEEIQYFMLEALESGKDIFQQATPSSFTTTTLEGILDYYSLAVQFLSVGFSSYVKAHVGGMQPFFLDTSLSVIKLFGIQDKERQSPQLTASLHRLTCLDDMIQSPVLVFREGQAKKQEPQKSYNLLASPEDLVDTWGPGQFLRSSSVTGRRNLTSIMIGGGVVKPTAENSKVLHWSNDVEPRHEFSVHFSQTEKILIAGGVEVNTACQSNKQEIWNSFRGSLENLGTKPDYWQFTEFQAGAAVLGQQFVGAQLQFNKTWTWHPGNSWKQQHLSLLANELPFNELDRPWGLQVSACTGVGRRVPLLLLLADLMPTFAETLALPSGWTTLQQQGIIQALEKGSQSLKLWYDGLCMLPNFRELQILTVRLIKYILLVLRDTGLDRDNKTFLIACPQNHTTGQPISMYLPVPCENASLWAKILRDSESCATFAYMTNLCLESQEHKCYKTHPWHCPSLDTAVQQVRVRREPITISSQAWNLEINSLYWIGVPESGLQARVMKSANSPFPRLHISKSGVPEKTRARLGTMSRLFGPKMNRLREKQIEAWPAEDVLILS